MGSFHDGSYLSFNVCRSTIGLFGEGGGGNYPRANARLNQPTALKIGSHSSMEREIYSRLFYSLCSELSFANGEN